VRARLTALLPLGLLLAAAIGVALGGATGAHYLGAGFPLLALWALARELAVALAGGALFVLFFAVAEAVLGRRLRPWPAARLAAALAVVPLLLAAGYRLNRALGVRPRELVRSHALVPNLLLVAGAAVLVAAAAWLFHRHRGRRGPGRAAAAVVLAAVGLGGGVSLAMRSPTTDRRPDVLVLLVDALGAEHLGAYGYPRDTTPHLDALAREGVLFREAIAASTFTKSSIASLFTGRFPYQHGVYWGSRKEGERVTADLLVPQEVTLAEVLRDHGYLTAAWVQNSHLREVMGFGQGFVDYHDQQGGIARIHRRLAPFLTGPVGRYPSFVYLHYIDLHDPYRPAPPFATRFGDTAGAYDGIDLADWGAYLAAVREGREVVSAPRLAKLRALYDGQLAYVDQQIGRLLSRLRARGLYDEALVVVTADHGDGFGQHGFISHSAAPYEELVRVPLLLKLPRGRFAGTVVEDPVRLVDLLPTILEAVGIQDLPPDLAGCPLQPLFDPRARAAERDPRCATAVIEIAEDDGPPTLALRTAGWKYIRDGAGTEELYDLEGDPGETTDLAAGRPEELARFRAAAAEIDRTREGGARSRIELDEQLREELKALGYLD
jgi:arylsulfatase A-like enzyme